VAERLADGVVGEEEQRRARQDAEVALLELRERDTLSTSKEFLFASAAERAAVNILSPDLSVIAHCGLDVAWCLVFLGSPVAHALLATQQEDELALIRDVFGNPFRPVGIDPAWLAWNDGAIRKLAEGIYRERALSRLPVLADALEEAGCSEADVLGHLREPGPHTRGCYALDALLGKS
jgi:hypothetical protein